jgi:hypothetical protein
MKVFADRDLDQLIAEQRIKLEITDGVPTWRVLPSPRHQMRVDRIRATIMPAPGMDAACGCHHLSDVYIRFPDDSLKRPDIAVFCAPPPEQDEALSLVPTAVIEIISPGYEDKDRFNAPWYLRQGVQDVIVLDPRTEEVTHYHADRVDTYPTPVVLTTLAGCRLTL